MFPRRVQEREQLFYNLKNVARFVGIALIITTYTTMISYLTDLFPAPLSFTQSIELFYLMHFIFVLQQLFPIASSFQVACNRLTFHGCPFGCLFCCSFYLVDILKICHLQHIIRSASLTKWKWTQKWSKCCKHSACKKQFSERFHVIKLGCLVLLSVFVWHTPFEKIVSQVKRFCLSLICFQNFSKVLLNIKKFNQTMSTFKKKKNICNHP